MKQHIKIIITLLLVFTSVLPIKANNKDELTILFTHDLHDNLDSYEMLVDGKTETRGGFARLSTAIQEERKIDPDLLLVDAGDYSMGTLFQTIFSTHSPALRLMGQMGYDATTLGNHEFDFRSDGLTQSLKAAMASGDPLPEIIASNTKFPEDIKNKDVLELQDTFKDFDIKDYLIIEKKGIKIALIGLMGEEADSNAPTADVDFLNMVEESKRVISKVKEDENVDLIVALSHAGTDGKPGKSEDEMLAKKVPEIDVIISGHSHTTLEEPIIVGKTLIVSSGRYSENLGTMTIEKDENRWTLKNYEIKPINTLYKMDPTIQTQVEDFKAKVNTEYLKDFNLEYDQVIAHSSFNFKGTKEIGDIQEEEPLGHLIADAYKYAVKKAEGTDYKEIDVTVVPSGVIRDSFLKGNISVKDVFKVSSLGIGKDKVSGYPLIDVYLTGKELKTAAEVDASIQPLMSVAQLYMSGLKYSFNPHRIIFNKLTDIKLIKNDQEEALVDDQLYRVVANLYSAQMLGIVDDQSMGLLSLVPKDMNGNVIENFEDQIIYDQGHELKEWVALSQYLESFPKKDGIPELDESYSMTHGFKVVEDDKGLIARFKNPNAISMAIIIIPIAIILLLIFIIRFIIKRRKMNK